MAKTQLDRIERELKELRKLLTGNGRLGVAQKVAVIWYGCWCALAAVGVLIIFKAKQFIN